MVLVVLAALVAPSAASGATFVRVSFVLCEEVRLPVALAPGQAARYEVGGTYCGESNNTDGWAAELSFLDRHVGANR